MLGCSVCERSTSKIIADVENKAKETRKSVIEVLYKDTHKHLVCERCISTHNLIRVCQGEPVLAYYPKSNKFKANLNAISTSLKERVIIDMGEYSTVNQKKAW